MTREVTLSQLRPVTWARWFGILTLDLIEPFRGDLSHPLNLSAAVVKEMRAAIQLFDKPAFKNRTRDDRALTSDLIDRVLALLDRHYGREKVDQFLRFTTILNCNLEHEGWNWFLYQNGFTYWYGGMRHTGTDRFGLRGDAEGLVEIFHKEYVEPVRSFDEAMERWAASPLSEWDTSCLERLGLTTSLNRLDDYVPVSAVTGEAYSRCRFQYFWPHFLAHTSREDQEQIRKILEARMRELTTYVPPPPLPPPEDMLKEG